MTNFFSQIADLQSKGCTISMQFDGGYWTIRVSHETKDTELLIREYGYKYPEDNDDLQLQWNRVYTKFMRAAQNGVTLQIASPDAQS